MWLSWPNVDDFLYTCFCKKANVHVNKIDSYLIVEPSISIFRKSTESLFVFAALVERNRLDFFWGGPKPKFLATPQNPFISYATFCSQFICEHFVFSTVNRIHNNVLIFFKTSQTSSMESTNRKQDRRTIQCKQRVSNITEMWLHGGSRLGAKDSKTVTSRSGRWPA